MVEYCYKLITHIPQLSCPFWPSGGSGYDGMDEERITTMKEISLLELLQSGAHFGHTTSRWNPKMKPYIFTVRSGIHILDLEKTKKALAAACVFAKETAQKGGTIVFVGTKRQSKEIVKQTATIAGMP